MPPELLGARFTINRSTFSLDPRQGKSMAMSDLINDGAVVVGAVGKISAFRPQGPQFDPGSAEI